jgi:hypothetical protein
MKNPQKRRKTESILTPSKVLENMLDDYFKKFNITFYAKLAEKQVDFLSRAYEEVCYKKIKTHLLYDDQIKDFEMMIMEEDSN